MEINVQDKDYEHGLNVIEQVMEEKFRSDPNYIHHVVNFSNDIFEFRDYLGEDCDCEPPDDWDPEDITVDFHSKDCEVGKPNFLHKPSGFEVRWYKHIGRGMEANKIISYKEWGNIICECLKSLIEDTTKE